jgi:hypothetical protein
MVVLAFEKRDRDMNGRQLRGAESSFLMQEEYESAAKFIFY